MAQEADSTHFRSPSKNLVCRPDDKLWFSIPFLRPTSAHPWLVWGSLLSLQTTVVCLLPPTWWYTWHLIDDEDPWYLIKEKKLRRLIRYHFPWPFYFDLSDSLHIRTNSFDPNAHRTFKRNIPSYVHPVISWPKRIMISRRSTTSLIIMQWKWDSNARITNGNPYLRNIGVTGELTIKKWLTLWAHVLSVQFVTQTSTTCILNCVNTLKI